MRRRSWLRFATASLAAVSAASGYYHFVHFPARSGPSVPVLEKFDLEALPNRTVHFFISEYGPAQLAPGDSLTALASQIRLAAKSWNDVESSELRVAFGGFAIPDTPHSTPIIDVVFDEVPPGLIALGGPTARAEAVARPNGMFIPISRSVVVLDRNLSQTLSFSEGFFLSLVHEFGHALGLQHTMTSSVMSTSLTRATTKARPLAADDVAGISILYPTARFLASTGSITGRVTMNGLSVNGASVMAISPQTVAISTLSNPDGSYRIEGLPQGSYYVIVHPLPPPFPSEQSPANIVLARDADGRPIAVTEPFETHFYPGVKDPAQASTVNVTSGAVAEGVHFRVTRRTQLAVYAVQTYSFPGQSAINPAYVAIGGPRPFLVAAGIGLTANGAASPTLGVSVLGGAAFVPVNGVRAYPLDTRYLQVDFQFTPFVAEGARHLLFTTANDLYVRPAGLFLSDKAPPLISALAPVNGSGLVALTGTNLTADTRVLFDGAAGAVRGLDETGRLLVAPPAAPAGHRAAVVALNADGQSSLFLQASNPVFHDYPAGEAPAFTIEPASLPAGVDAMVEIAGSAAGFVEGQTLIGFGTPDVRVRRVWVIGPARVLANVSVSPEVSRRSYPVTVASGLALLKHSNEFQALAPSATQLSFQLPALDAVTGEAAVRVGAQVRVRVANLPDPAPVGLQMSLNDRPVSVSAAGGFVTFRVPTNMALGPAVLRMIAGADTALPVVLHIEAAQPVILAVTASNGAVGPTRPAAAGEQLTVTTNGLGEAGATIAPARVKVIVGGIEHEAVKVTSLSPLSATHEVQFVLGWPVASGPQTMVVTIDGRPSAAFTMPVR